MQVIKNKFRSIKIKKGTFDGESIVINHYTLAFVNDKPADLFNLNGKLSQEEINFVKESYFKKIPAGKVFTENGNPISTIFITD